MATKKLVSSCSVCFRNHKLTAKGKPTRHGFRVVTQGMGSGHWGAWHTDSCPGGGFPHFGASTEGTEWALARCNEALEQAHDHRVKLDSRPPLPWTPNKYDARHGAGPITVLDGCPERKLGVRWIQHSSYDELYKSAVGQADREIASLERQIAAYVEALAEWKAFAPWPAPSADSERPKHAKITRVRRGYEYDSPRCADAYRARSSVLYAETDDEVTCSRCKKSLAAAATEAAKLAKRVERALNQCKGAGRELLEIAARNGNADGFRIANDREAKAASKLRDVGLLKRTPDYQYIITEAGRVALLNEVR